jgi:hypothetical protein
MESVDLDVNQFFKAMESVLGKASQEKAGNDTETDRKSSSSDMDFGILPSTSHSLISICSIVMYILMSLLH